MSDIVFVIGNGESRLQFDLNSLRPLGKLYGCNALYRDFDPDVLLAIDKHMSDEVVASGYAAKHTCYFANDDRALPIPADCLVGEYGKSQYCGPTAIRLAIQQEKPRSIYLLGFDIIDKKWSNVYVATRGYADNRELAKQVVAQSQNVIHNPPTLAQLHDLFIEHPEILFYKVMEAHNFQYTQWQGIKNLIYLTPDKFHKIVGV